MLEYADDFLPSPWTDLSLCPLFDWLVDWLVHFCIQVLFVRSLDWLIERLNERIFSKSNLVKMWSLIRSVSSQGFLLFFTRLYYLEHPLKRQEGAKWFWSKKVRLILRIALLLSFTAQSHCETVHFYIPITFYVGAFKDIDFAMMVHPWGHNDLEPVILGNDRVCSFAAFHISFIIFAFLFFFRGIRFVISFLLEWCYSYLTQCQVEFFGKAAHASCGPWDGVNALDAAVAVYENVAMLRQRMKPNWRIHGVITNGGAKPNIIPDYTVSQYMVRAPTQTDLDFLKGKVMEIFHAAAKATGDWNDFSRPCIRGFFYKMEEVSCLDHLLSILLRFLSQSINQSINRPNNQSTEQSINRPDSQSINRSDQ